MRMLHNIKEYFGVSSYRAIRLRFLLDEYFARSELKNKINLIG